MSLTFLGDLALIQDKMTKAPRVVRRSRADPEERLDANWLAYSVRRLGHLAWRAGDHQRAFELCSESLRLNQEVFDPRGVLACLAGFAAVAVPEVPTTTAAMLAAAVEAQLDCLRASGCCSWTALEYERRWLNCTGALGPSKLEKLCGPGARRMSLEEAMAFALASRGVRRKARYGYGGSNTGKNSHAKHTLKTRQARRSETPPGYTGLIDRHKPTQTDPGDQR